MKYIWVVEKADNFGEFQPCCELASNDRQVAVTFLEAAKEISPTKKLRIMRYVRSEVR